MKKRKILLLHGNHQTGTLLLGRINRLERKLKNLAYSKVKNEDNNQERFLLQEQNNKQGKKKQKINNNDNNNALSYQIIAPDGPFPSGLLLDTNTKEKKKKQEKNHDYVEENDGSMELKSWWIRNDQDPNEYVGFSKTIELLSDLNERDEIEGIIGFSQGARLAYLIFHLFPKLKFIIFVSGYHYDLPEPIVDANVKRDMNIKTLHIMGERDRLITPSQSMELSEKFSNSQIHLHSLGHCVPMKAPDVQKMLQFILDNHNINEVVEEEGDLKKESSSSTATKRQPKQEQTKLEPKQQQQPPDEEHAEIQNDECEALEMIFPEEFQLYNEESSHPISYTIKLTPPDDGSDSSALSFIYKRPVSLFVEYTPNYPDELPVIKLQHDYNLMQWKSIYEDTLIQTLKQTCENELGMPSIMSCVYAAKEFLYSQEKEDTNTLIYLFNNNKSNHIPTSNKTNNKDDDDKKVEKLTEQLEYHELSDDYLQQCDLEGQEIAFQYFFSQQNNNKINVCSESDNASSTDNNNSDQQTNNGLSSPHGKGGIWNYKIGLIGKPSAGKSTFFNAATAFARQRGQSKTTVNNRNTNNSDDGTTDESNDDILIGGASMAPHPFTTIDPNIGYCLVPAPFGLCPEDDDDINSGNFTYGSTHGRTKENRRLVPILLKDVAGLVPGAYKGLGKGNKFLNDLTDADVLIHILDSSGTADSKGNSFLSARNTTQTKEDPEEQNNNNIHQQQQQFHDLAWIRHELLEWIHGNVHNKWDKIQKYGYDKLVDMFSGYRQTQAFLWSIINLVTSFNSKHHHHDKTTLENWDEGDLRRLISAYLGIRFPMVIALNKYDLLRSTSTIDQINESLPIHGARAAVTMSARKEMSFVKKHLISSTAKKNNETQEKDEQHHDHHGKVWKCLQEALLLRPPVLVFPVSDLNTFAPMKGLNDHATRDPSLPSPSMNRCIVASGGKAPTHFEESKQIYAISSSSTTKGAAASVALRDVLMMKQSSTVQDVFTTLKNMGALSGEFVRAEGTGHVTEKPKQISKHDLMGKHNRIIRIMTTKRSQWQK